MCLGHTSTSLHNFKPDSQCSVILDTTVVPTSQSHEAIAQEWKNEKPAIHSSSCLEVNPLILIIVESLSSTV